jgi:hypothetical protein
MICSMCEEEFEIDEPVVRRGYWSADGIVAQPTTLDPMWLEFAGITEEEFRDNATLAYLHGACLAKALEITKDVL